MTHKFAHRQDLSRPLPVSLLHLTVFRRHAPLSVISSISPLPFIPFYAHPSPSSSLHSLPFSSITRIIFPSFPSSFIPFHFLRSPASSSSLIPFLFHHHHHLLLLSPSTFTSSSHHLPFSPLNTFTSSSHHLPISLLLSITFTSSHHLPFSPPLPIIFHLHLSLSSPSSL